MSIVETFIVISYSFNIVIFYVLIFETAFNDMTVSIKDLNFKRMF